MKRGKVRKWNNALLNLYIYSIWYTRLDEEYEAKRSNKKKSKKIKIKGEKREETEETC